MSLLLAVETVTGPFSIALFKANEPIAYYQHEVPHMQAELLVQSIGAMLRDCSCSYSDIEDIAVSIGPGSFTGIRIGIAAMQGIAIVTGARIIGVSSLEAIAHSFSGDAYSVALYAGRGQFYLQSFSKPHEELLALSQIALIAQENLALEDNVKILDPYLDPVACMSSLNAKNIGFRAIQKRGHNIATEHLMPIYVRDADAKLPSS